MSGLIIATFIFVVGILSALWVIFTDLNDLRAKLDERDRRHLELLQLILAFERPHAIRHDGLQLQLEQEALRRRIDAAASRMGVDLTDHTRFPED